jgi:hypothetical protein
MTLTATTIVLATAVGAIAAGAALAQSKIENETLL